MLTRKELPQRLVFVRYVVTVTYFEAKCGVLKRMEELPNLRAWLDELLQRFPSRSSW